MPSVEVLFYLLVNEPVVQLSQVGEVTRFGYIFICLLSINGKQFFQKT